MIGSLYSVKYSSEIKAAIAVIAGLIVGLMIGIITEYYTSADYKPVQKIGRAV